MSIKVGVLSEDVERQIELLKVYSEIAEKYYRPAFIAATDALTLEIRPTIPVMTGRAMSKFRGTVTGKGLNLTGSIGLAATKKAPWYINVVEYGARPHWMVGSIRNRRSQWLRFQAAWNAGDLNARRKAAGVPGIPVMISGQWKTMGIHPGLAGRGFMHRGAQRMQPLVESIMGPANEAVARELVVP